MRAIRQPFRRRYDRLRSTGDAGLSLAELLVAMTITATIMAGFTTAVVQMFRATTDTETLASAQSAVNLRFLRLDKEVRYAAGISIPTTPDGNGSTVVEYLRTDEARPTCTQLWLDGVADVLRSRSWVQVQDTPEIGPWSVLLSNVSSAQAFTFIPAVPPSYSQRLRLQLTVTAQGRASRARTLDVTFTALNTSLATSSGTVCAEGRPPA